MPNVPDYSLYIGVKKVRATQTANTNTAIIKGRAPYLYDGYFPLYRSVGLPINALVSNKFTQGLGGTPAPPPFSPDNISTMGMWLDGIDSSSMVLSGSTVTQWNDKSGNSHNGVSVSSPQLGTTTTGRQCVVFNGSNYFNISNANTLSGGSMTIFVQASATVDSRNMFAIWGNTRIISHQLYYNGNIIFFPSSTIFLNANTMACIVENASTTVCSSFFNGTAGNTTTSVSTTPTTEFVLGIHFNLTNGWIGNIQEFIIYNRALLMGERQMVEGYLAWKWGTEGSLPANHPYKLAKP